MILKSVRILLPLLMLILNLFAKNELCIFIVIEMEEEMAKKQDTGPKTVDSASGTCKKKHPTSDVQEKLSKFCVFGYLVILLSVHILTMSVFCCFIYLQLEVNLIWNVIFS